MKRLKKIKQELSVIIKKALVQERKDNYEVNKKRVWSFLESKSISNAERTRLIKDLFELNKERIYSDKKKAEQDFLTNERLYDFL